ncbi:flagellar filament capping protein FliD [Endozoicomonas lisbonensis]|uniref:Flagellar hook-associated protein 2 n=1 Tax=Endozoicomonas lisbonensis TaxID=3120522 RepID=A0ABV2SBH2_9GAMM
MSGISMGGMGTGLDIYGMATQMATLQITPKATQLTRREGAINEEIAALNELTGSLNSFYNSLNRYSDVTRFGSVSVSMAEDDEKYAGISVDETAITNTYSLQVNELAQQHKVELFAVDATGDNAGEITEELAGEYTIVVAGERLTIEIAEGDNIADIAEEINNHSDNPGVTASLLSDGEQSYLTLTSDETGVDNAITVRQGNDKLMLETLQDAQDAEFFIDGKRMTSATNRVEDAIPGVTIDLKSTNDEAFTFEVRSDTSKMTSSARAIVDSFNDVLSTLDSLGSRSMDDDGNVTRGPLAGDPMINGIRNELRHVQQMTFDGPYPNLASIGVMTNRNGDLEVDTSVLQEALDEDPKAVTEMFLEVVEEWQDVSTKYIGRPEEDESEGDEEDEDYVPPPSNDDKYIPKDGLIDARVETLERNLRAVESEWEVVETRYESIYQRYLNEFIAMDLAVAQMQQSMFTF